MRHVVRGAGLVPAPFFGLLEAETVIERSTLLAFVPSAAGIEVCGISRYRFNSSPGSGCQLTCRVPWSRRMNVAIPNRVRTRHVSGKNRTETVCTRTEPIWNSSRVVCGAWSVPSGTLLPHPFFTTLKRIARCFEGMIDDGTTAR